jgi:RimJ/RimL family protein N-acetyltransferase
VPYWNQGYATEAARRVIAWAFEDLRLNRVYARYLLRNPASGRVMRKAGLRPEGTFPQDALKNGVFEDLGQCGLVRSEYSRTGE